MKALLICPAARAAVVVLTEKVPLANVPILGKSLVEYWLEHLVSRGAREVLVLASDRPEQVRAVVGDGARWGLQVRVFPESRELTPAEALAKYATEDGGDWLPAPDHARVMDHLPGLPECPLLASQAGWFDALMRWLPQAATPDRIGVREIKPGVWAGLRARVSPAAELRAPCWLGENVRLGAGAVVGPQVILEAGAFVESGAEIAHSIIGPETFVGRYAEIRHSLAWGNLLANWRLGSCIRVVDSFLLSSLDRSGAGQTLAGAGSRSAALLAMVLTLPLVLPAILAAKLRGRPALRPRLAVRPRPVAGRVLPDDRLVYHELNGAPRWLRRWPQLWKIVRGDFCWIGNPPLNPRQAAGLASEFEQLWLAAPIGLISLADVEGCADFQDVETRAHASYYAVQRGWRLHGAILARALFRFVAGVPWSRARESLAPLRAPRPVESRPAH